MSKIFRLANVDLDTSSDTVSADVMFFQNKRPQLRVAFDMSTLTPSVTDVDHEALTAIMLHNTVYTTMIALYADIIAELSAQMPVLEDA